MKNCIEISVIVILVALAASYFYTVSPILQKCDLSKPENRNYKVYYGLEDITIPFGKYNAERNTDAPLFRPMITEKIENSPSIIVLGEYGSGKTQIRNYRLAKYDPKKTWVIDLGSKLEKYLEVYLKSNESSIENLGSNHILDLIMSGIVDEVLSFDIDDHIKKKLKLVGQEERVKFAYLITVYSDSEQKSVLTSVLNEILFDKTKCWTCSSVDFECNIKNQDELDGIKRLLNEYVEKNEKAAHYLYCLEQLTQSPLNFLRENSKKVQIRFLSNFLKEAFGKNLVVVIDSLEQNSFLFSKDLIPNMTNLQAVVNSVLNSEILTLALGNKEDIVFDAMIFLPLIEKLNIQILKENFEQILFFQKIPKAPILRLPPYPYYI